MKRKALAVLAASTLALGVGAYLFEGIGIAAVPSSISVYGGSANAAGVHAVGGTNVFPNFSTGAVDNRYPFANVVQDVSPFSAANSSYDDYGPLGTTVYAGVPPASRPSSPPVDYARAQYPNPPGVADQAKVAPDGRSHYEAHARELGSDALGFYAGDPTSTFKNMTAEAHTLVAADGSITTTTHSHVGSATFGPVAVANTDVVTKIVSRAGKAVVTDKIFAGNVTANGQPVSVGDQGVTVTGTPVSQVVPGGVATETPLIKVYTVAPVIKNDGHGGASILATGLHVGVLQPGQGATIPSQYVDYILGEGADSDFLVPADSLSTSVDTSSLGSGGGGTGSTDNPPVGAVISDTITTPPNAGSYTDLAPLNTVPHQKSSASRPLQSIRLVGKVKPPLAYMFFLWEALVLGAASALVWARRSGASTLT